MNAAAGSWAYNLRINPTAKLLAIYIATQVGGPGPIDIHLDKASDWTGLPVSIIKASFGIIPDIRWRQITSHRVSVKFPFWATESDYRREELL